MKNFVAAVVVVIIAVLFVTPTFAHKPKTKDDAFNENATIKKTNKPDELEKAYKLGKDFVTRFAADKDEKVAQIKNFVAQYRLRQFLGAVDSKKFSDAFTFGKEILVDEPENTEVLINLATAGYNAREKGDMTFVVDTVAYANKSAELLAAGTLPKSFAPYKDQSEATAWMYFISGFLGFEKDIKASAVSVYKSLQYESPFKSNPLPYYIIATFYENQYETLTKAKADVKTIEATIDRMLDAYARTCKRSEATKHPSHEAWQTRYAQIYKFRKKMDVG